MRPDLAQCTDYVVAVQAPAYPISPSCFATESAFAEHLRALKKEIGPRFARLVLISPIMSEQEYAAQKHHLGKVTLEDGIAYVPAHPLDVSPLKFWKSHARAIWHLITQVMVDAAIVHSGVSEDIWRPLMAMVNLAALISKRPIVFYVDVDFRSQSEALFRLGIWGTKSYLSNRLFHDPLRWIQVWLAPRLCALVMLKSQRMVRDFGRGKPHVKGFFNTVHSEENVLSAESLDERMEWLRTRNRPLHLVYFGRLVRYKGLDKALEGVRFARESGEDVRFTIIGDGPCLAELQEQVRKSDLAGAVSFVPQVSYGDALFDHLRHTHMAIATPLSDDTPRSAFDAMARGLPIVAFNLPYFEELAASSGAVTLVQWPDSNALGRTIVELSRDRDRLATMAQKGVDFALRNTQHAWLRQRTQWTMHFALGEDHPSSPTAIVPQS